MTNRIGIVATGTMTCNAGDFAVMKNDITRVRYIKLEGGTTLNGAAHLLAKRANNNPGVTYFMGFNNVLMAAHARVLQKYLFSVSYSPVNPADIKNAYIHAITNGNQLVFDT